MNGKFLLKLEVPQRISVPILVAKLNNTNLTRKTASAGALFLTSSAT